jgi:hypothetical protein
MKSKLKMQTPKTVVILSWYRGVEIHILPPPPGGGEGGGHDTAILSQL